MYKKTFWENKRHKFRKLPRSILQDVILTLFWMGFLMDAKRMGAGGMGKNQLTFSSEHFVKVSALYHDIFTIF